MKDSLVEIRESRSLGNQFKVTPNNLVILEEQRKDKMRRRLSPGQNRA
jgi:hypothetical protein